MANAMTIYGLRVTFAKGEPQEAIQLEFEGWNIHSQVVASRPTSCRGLLLGRRRARAEDEGPDGLVVEDRRRRGHADDEVVG
jgi:hypothetical protein